MAYVTREQAVILARNAGAEGSADRLARIGESLASGSPLAHLAHENPLYFADEFIADMQQGVEENARINCDRNENGYTGWTDAQHIISVYDDWPLDDSRNDRFSRFARREQRYIVRQLNSWLKQQQYAQMTVVELHAILDTKYRNRRPPPRAIPERLRYVAGEDRPVGAIARAAWPDSECCIVAKRTLDGWDYVIDDA